MKLGRIATRLMKPVEYGIAAVVMYCILHVLLVMFPGPLFPYQHTYKNFMVHMREEIPPEITGVSDRVESLLSASDLNDQTLHHDIYLVNSFRLSRFLLVRNVHFGCNMPMGHTFITNADVPRDIARCELIGPDDRRIRTLSETIAHEITHALIRNHVGRPADRRLPVWLKEGYCEFVADGSAIDHRTGPSLPKGTSPAFTPGLNNFRYRLVVEYLINDRGMTIDELIRRPPDYREVEAEVIAGLREDERAFLKRPGSRIGSSDRGGGAWGHGITAKTARRSVGKLISCSTSSVPGVRAHTWDRVTRTPRCAGVWFEAAWMPGWKPVVRAEAVVAVA